MTIARAENSVLAVVDIQEKLAPAMNPDVRREVLAGVGVLLQAAETLDVPVIATEQYPKGLGATLPEVSDQFPQNVQVLSKDSFSCCGESAFSGALEATGRSQVVLLGMEAHVCVLQTALELRGAGYTPFVAEDGICSRRADHKENALHRLRSNGVQVANVESILFEWLQQAGTDSFKKLARLIR
ncbi:isochorismatase family protein [Thiohalorhabdus methylotrophus]|uniref:Isochorismatase family protein n=1 Tax=Thiohalorhabdus methylotrophus TaxID=3242694 RepID=A0ABV4TPH2_9GAMM